MEKNISDSIALTVAEIKFTELPAEIIEFSIDQILDEGLLKDIPVVGWIAKGLAVGQSISDRIFHHKILRFLLSLETVSKGERDAFVIKIRDNLEFRRKVGEHLLILIDKIDALDKTTLLAQCFDHFMTGHISHNHFVDLAGVIERTPISDLKALCVPINRQVRFRHPGIAAACGILEFGLCEPEVAGEPPELGTKMSGLGRNLRDIFLDRFRDRLEAIKKKKQSD